MHTCNVSRHQSLLAQSKLNETCSCHSLCRIAFWLFTRYQHCRHISFFPYCEHLTSVHLVTYASYTQFNKQQNKQKNIKIFNKEALNTSTNNRYKYDKNKFLIMIDVQTIQIETRILAIKSSILYQLT